MPVWYIQVVRILLAAVLGGVIGLERQFHGKVAGVRTNMLICLGAAVVTVVSQQMGLQYDDSVGRIAAQIVSGVGFLGAGVIIRDRASVHGLTTAATIWLVAAVGMAVGAGSYLLAVAATLVAVGILVGWRNWPTKPADYAKGSKDTE